MSLISTAIAVRLRDRGLILDPNKMYEDARVQEIAKEMSVLFERLADLDMKLIELSLKNKRRCDS
jgi:hypothetical protein